MEETVKSVIEVKDLSFRYRRKPILQHLSFQVREGEFLALVGPNGIGKSTLLSILAGILKPQSGEVFCHGRVGYLPQGTALFEDMTVEDNLRFFCGLMRCDVPKILPFGLNERRNERVGTLSGGQKKQVSIACALIGEPGILLLDEPAEGLDVLYQEELKQLLAHLKEEGCTILYVGHNPMEYAALYDRMLYPRYPAQYFERTSLSGDDDDNSFFYKNYIKMMKDIK